MREIGANGQAIYDSRAWRQFWEAPTQVDCGPFSDGKNIPYTNQDFRFTAKGGAVYAFLMEPAVNQWQTIQALADERENPASRFHGIIEDMSLIGYEEPLEWEQTPQGLRLFMPNVAADLLLVLKVQLR